METLAQDIRYALVTMRRNKGFTVTALLTLALGIGVTTAVFSVVYGVLMRPLPYHDADRLVELAEEHPGAVSPLRNPVLSNLTYHAWLESPPRTLDAMAAYVGADYTVALPGGAQRLTAAGVTPSLFGMVGAAPALGRFFRAEEAAKGADGVVVLSHRAWQLHFSGDPSIVGRSVEIDARPYLIVGVARPEFYFPDRKTLFWLPYDVVRPSPDAVAGGRGIIRVIHAFGRLKPDATAEQAEAEGTVAARTTIRPLGANLLFGEGGPPVVHARRVLDSMTGRIRPALLVLGAAVLLVLLIACANVANLFLSRGLARERELTVRAAIGASRGRLVRQLLTESLVLAVLGGAAGIFIASAAVRAVRASAANDFPRLDAIQLDWTALAFAVAASLCAGLVSGLAPAVRGAARDLAASLHGGDGGSAAGFRGREARRIRDVILAGEAAFAIVLLVGATLLARSFIRLTHVDAGYTPANLLAAQVYVPGPITTENGDRLTSRVAVLRERLGGLPGVTVVGAGNTLPLDNATMLAVFPAPGQARSGTAGKPKVARTIMYLTTPGYAEALGLRLRAGRMFTDADTARAVRSAIVNEEFARLYLPPNPVGMQWESDPNEADPRRTNEIVGVVANVLKDGNDARPQAEYYMVAPPARFMGRFEVAIRTAGNPETLGPAVRNAIRELEPTAAIEISTMSERLAASVDQPRFAMTVLTAFAALALALASVGLYGVLSYAVSQRRRELGVRAALGASRPALVRLVVREGLAATTAGLVLGLLGAAALTRLMQSVLFGVTPLDPISFAIAPVLLVSVALLACALPANRAAAADPAESLRCE